MYDLKYTNGQIGGVWNLPRVSNWPFGVL